jgi:hypothetical protein
MRKPWSAVRMRCTTPLLLQLLELQVSTRCVRGTDRLHAIHVQESLQTNGDRTRHPSFVG